MHLTNFHAFNERPERANRDVSGGSVSTDG